ncbi:bcl-2 homologous antagonist/killer [Pithys albifrons albifrons]|uniref:bcl-2 homologous antagonist/killer n=1 Tax=Pithys albifrons albifrons TaxID=3385563 RepID=UPI003A5CFCDF
MKQDKQGAGPGRGVRCHPRSAGQSPQFLSSLSRAASRGWAMPQHPLELPEEPPSPAGAPQEPPGVPALSAPGLVPLEGAESGASAPASFSLLFPGPGRFLSPRARGRSGWSGPGPGCRSSPTRGAAEFPGISTMASGGEGDPPRGPEHGGSSRHSPSRELSSEEQVAAEAEGVFRSYAFYRYQQEREERGPQVPTDPEMEQIQQDMESTVSQAGRRLAIIGDDIYRRYDPEFCSMLNTLQLTDTNALEHFTKIASSLFESGINWGRVIALLSFGYRMAIHVYRHGLRGFLSSITRCIVKFMVQHRITHWIAQQGGWVAALNLDNVHMRSMLVLMVVIVVGHLVWRFLRQ